MSNKYIYRFLVYENNFVLYLHKKGKWLFPLELYRSDLIIFQLELRKGSLR